MNECQKPDGSVPSTISMVDEIAKIARGDTQRAADIEWAIARWYAEVSQRPLVNVHRRTLDDTWRQVIRYLGGDNALKLIGTRHDELLACQGDPCVCGRHGTAGVRAWPREQQPDGTVTTVDPADMSPQQRATYGVRAWPREQQPDGTVTTVDPADMSPQQRATYGVEGTAK